MATIVKVDFQCPNCHKQPLIKIDKMLRCTCGWWTIADDDEEVSVNNLNPLTILAS